MRSPLADVEHRFTSYAKDAEHAERMEVVRKTLREAAEVVLRRTLPGREQALALTKLEEAMFWANVGIAREDQ